MKGSDSDPRLNRWTSEKRKSFRGPGRHDVISCCGCFWLRSKARSRVYAHALTVCAALLLHDELWIILYSGLQHFLQRGFSVMMLFVEWDSV